MTEFVCSVLNLYDTICKQVDEEHHRWERHGPCARLPGITADCILLPADCVPPLRKVYRGRVGLYHLTDLTKDFGNFEHEFGEIENRTHRCWVILHESEYLCARRLSWDR